MSDEIDLEEALRRALRAAAPPENFACLVLQKTVGRRRQRVFRGRLAVAAALLLGGLLTTAVLDYQARQEAAERKAGQQLAAALRIAGHKVHLTHQMIRRRNGTTTNGATTHGA